MKSRSPFDKLDIFLLRFEPCLNWLMIVWAALAISIIVLSNIMNQFGWPPLGTILPFDVRDNFKVGLLLAPSGVIAALYLIRGAALKAKRKGCGNKANDSVEDRDTGS